MKLTIQLQLLPTPVQAALLLGTMRRVNEAATFAARCGFDAGVFSQPSIHKLTYFKIRQRFQLSAQLAVRAIGKSVECFARDKTICPVFRPDGAITYDQRNLSFKGLDRVSLATLTGREVVALVYGEYQAQRFDRIKGQCDLVHRDSKFYLLATVDLPEPPPGEVKDFLGVDLGIVNIATDSTGETFSGTRVDRNRKRKATARKQHQRKGTRGSRRKLKKMAGRQRRFQAHENHVIAKKIVGKAKALGIGIAMEDLTFIRDRVEPTVSRHFRRRFGNWGFFQLRSFVEYKARLAGVPVVLVDPRNTSRPCRSAVTATRPIVRARLSFAACTADTPRMPMSTLRATLHAWAEVSWPQKSRMLRSLSCEHPVAKPCRFSGRGRLRVVPTMTSRRRVVPAVMTDLVYFPKNGCDVGFRNRFFPKVLDEQVFVAPGVSFTPFPNDLLRVLFAGHGVFSRIKWASS